MALPFMSYFSSAPCSGADFDSKNSSWNFPMSTPPGSGTFLQTIVIYRAASPFLSNSCAPFHAPAAPFLAFLVYLEGEQDHPGGGGGEAAAFSESWTPTPGSGSVRSGSSASYGRSDPPEKQLTLLALRVAILEKAASGLGKLDFVWATVVLLGGFVGSLNITDFWCITVIIVGEGARVFSRSHELEWQHHATETSTAGGALRSSSRFFRRILHVLVDHTGGGGGEQEPHQHATQTPDAGGALRSSSRFFRRVVHAMAHPAADGGADVGGDASKTSARFQNQIAAVMKKRTGHAPNGVPLLPYTGQGSTSRNIGRLLNWLQVLSALFCVALSVMRLCVGAGCRNGCTDGDRQRARNACTTSLSL